MAYDVLKAAIASVVKQNGNNEITGNLLQQALFSIINSLGANYQFAGVATPSTNPGTPDQNVFYIALTAGTYTNFNGIVVENGITILEYNGSWSKDVVLTIDDSPVISSNNLAKSGGIALQFAKTNQTSYDCPGVNGSYRQYSHHLYGGRRYRIQNTTPYNCKFYKDDGTMSNVYIINAGFDNIFIFIDDVIGPFEVLGNGAVTITPVDDVIKAEILAGLMHHCQNEAIASFVKELYIADGLCTDATLQLSGSQIYLYLGGSTTGHNSYNFSLDDYESNSVKKIDDGIYIILDKTFLPSKGFVSPVINMELHKNPSIGVYLSDNEKKIIVITANSDVNSGADFTGNNAIQNAIDSITDASENRQYIIRCTGEFNFSKITDYKYDAGYGMWFGINGKNYVHLDGISKNNCIIKGSLSPVLTDVQNDVPVGAGYSFGQEDYGKVIAIQWNANANISNITCVARNIRYPIHTDGSEFGCKNYVATYSDCDFSHEGKYGDAVGTIGGSASGFGLSSGQNLKFERCRFNGNFYIHTNKDYEDGAILTVEDCEYLTNPNQIAANDGIKLAMMDAPVKSKIVFKGTKFSKQRVVSIGASLYNYQHPIAENVFDIDMVATEMEPLAIFKSANVAPVLRITANSENSTIRFNENSSAFNKIIGDSSKTISYIDRWFRTCQYGYKYLDGGVGLKGYAQGQWNITESAIRGNYVTSLGKRLGDCSTQNLSLGVIVNNVSYTITFNRDYRNVSNADIIAEINSVIGSVATCSVFYVDNEYFPEFGCIEVSVNADNTAILAGMGVVYIGGGLRRAKNTDGYIDGIALNDAPVGGKCRIMTKGGISLEKPSVTNTNYVLNRKSNEPQYWNIPDGSKWGISTDEDGVFDLSATPKFVIKSNDNKCSII